MISRETWSRTARTFVQSFLGVFIPGLVIWLTQVQEWATAEFAGDFPALGPLLAVGVSAGVAALVSAVTLLWNVLEDALGAGGDKPLQRTPPA